MEYLVTAEEMRRCDRATSEHFLVSEAVLMERAALACVEVLQKEPSLRKLPAYHKRTLVVAGIGNNGGDGFAVGRLLMQAGYPVDYWLVGEREKGSLLMLRQMAGVEAYGSVVMEEPPQKEYAIVIDALFGIGLTRQVTGVYRKAVEYINRSRAFILSVDIPSGIHANTGEVLGAAVCATATVTFGFRKLGTFLYPGTQFAGRLVCKPIGITKESFLGDYPAAFTYTEAVTELLPKRERVGNKGTFGKVCLIAGSDGMAGAALLAGRAVFASGVGMLKIITASENRIILQTGLPEAMTACYAPKQGAAVCRQVYSWADVVAIGPGIGNSQDSVEMLEYVIEETRCPLVVDADALNLLAAHRELLNRLAALQGKESDRRSLVLTPHPGEFARLEGCSIAEILKNDREICQKWAQKLRAAVLCKQARTLVAAPGRKLYYNSSGNSGMATAGSGDVLTGVIAGLLAQGTDSFDAACIGAYLHGLAGDRAAFVCSEYGMKAGDIVRQISKVLAKKPHKPVEWSQNDQRL